MGLFGNKPGNGRSDQSGKQPGPEYAEISGIIDGRLSSERDEIVLIGIGDLMSGEARGHKYRPGEVIDRLAALIQIPHGEEVTEKAGNALIERLKNGVHFEDAQYVITNRLGGRSERNAKFFVKMLDKLEYKPEMRRLAVEMLASFRGVELSPSTVDSIEMALLGRRMHPMETEEVKNAIKNRFGTVGKGRPQIKIEEGNKEETVLIETEATPKPAPEFTGPRDVETAAMDIDEGFLMQLRDKDPLQREKAAKALIMRLEGAKRSQMEKILGGVAPVKGEFPELNRKVLAALQKTLPEGLSSKPPIALGPGNEKRSLGSKDPTPIAPINTVRGK